MTARREPGFIAIEWVAAVAMLLLPAVVLVATLPTWAERGTRRRSRPARQSATSRCVGPAGDAAEAELVAKYVAADHGIAAADVSVRVLAVGANPGDQIEVEVDVRMPAIAVPGSRPGRRVDVLDGRVGASRRLPQPLMRRTHAGA